MRIGEPAPSGRGHPGLPPLVLGGGGVGVLLLLPLVVDVIEAGSPGELGSLVAVVAATAAGLLLPWTRIPHRLWWTTLSLLVLLVLAVVTTRELGAAWRNVWLMLSITVGSLVGASAVPVVTGLGGVLVITVLSGLVVSGPRLQEGEAWGVMLTVFLSGASNIVLVQLIGTIRELQLTQRELARRAVAEERERFSRDLHDLLGHTLSVVVVKAEAVRRLIPAEPDAAAEHARDIESIGRRALTEIREAADGSRHSSLAAEVARAQVALESAGIDATLTTASSLLPRTVDEALAWVVREGVTNVLRHSGAERCRLVVEVRDGTATLEIVDDGVRRDAASGPGNGLAGLRKRMSDVDGELVAGPGHDGFHLVARVPNLARQES